MWFLSPEKKNLILEVALHYYVFITVILISSILHSNSVITEKLVSEIKFGFCSTSSFNKPKSVFKVLNSNSEICGLKVVSEVSKVKCSWILGFS